MSEQPPPSSDDAEPADVPRGARPHHYLFAREWLRQSFRRRPEMMVLGLARAARLGDGAEPVRETWRGMGKSLPEPDRIDPDGIEVRTFVDESPTRVFFAIIDLPPPMATGESHAIGLAVAPPDDELEPEGEDQENPREGTDTWYGLAEATDEGPRLVLVNDEGARPLEHRVADDPGESLLMALRRHHTDTLSGKPGESEQADD